jgi:predicted dehydrogenase
MTGLRLGIVGSGFIAQFHTRAIQQVRGLEIAGVTSPRNADKLAQMVRDWGLGEGNGVPRALRKWPHM